MPHHMLRTRRASSLIRSGDQAGSQTRLILTTPTPGTLATAFSTMVGNSPAAGQFGVDILMTLTTPNCPAAGELPTMVENAVVLDVDLVDQPELIDVSRDFRIEHGLQRRHDLGGQPLGLLRRQRRMGLGVDGLRFGRITHANKSCALISACTRWSTSSRVLYIPNEARQVAVTLNRSKAASRNACRRAPLSPAGR